MVGIVFATRREAQPFLTQTSAAALASRPFALYRIQSAASVSCVVAISGMGKVAAAMASMHLVMDLGVTALVSAGLCGQLIRDNQWALGDLFRITRAVEGDCDRFGEGEPHIACASDWFRRLDEARLVTCDRPVFDARWRVHLVANGDLADMEGAAVARVAKRYGIPCAMVKGISDTADEDGRKAVARNIDWVSARIADALIDELRTRNIK